MDLSVIGAYGTWAAGLVKGTPALSFRNQRFTQLAPWRRQARRRALDLMAPPVLKASRVQVNERLTFDGLDIKLLSWQLPYGPATQAVLLKPAGAKGRLPGMLAFHDHGGKKFWGRQKITRLPTQHPLMVEHQQQYYGGRAWANEIARRGYVVLVSDTFPFASRMVLPSECLPAARGQAADPAEADDASINAYNSWSGGHENVMAKSLFCAGTTWPGVFWAEDRVALDILARRPDVDSTRLGCAGLSGGGMRTNFLAGLDDRIRCAVSVGFMTTWRDALLNKTPNHTWMCYVPLLPRDLDMPEILGLRVPLATMVQSTREDSLYTLPEVQRAEKQLRAIYRKAGASDHFDYRFYSGPHKFDVPMQADAFDWLDRWLK